MSTSHLDRKEFKRPDAFQEKAADLFDFFGKHKASALVALVAILATAIGTGIYSKVKTKKNDEASSALFLARRTFAESQDLAKLEKVANDFKGTQAAYQALLVAGDSYFAKGDYTKSGEYYGRAAEQAPSRSMKAIAQHSLAYSYENNKQYEQALESLRQVLASGEQPIKADTLMALARNYATKGDKTKAAEQYDQVSKEYPGSPLAKSAEALKLQLK